MRAFVLLATLGACWVVATAAFGVPDEPSHVIRAWAAAHGEVIGHDEGPLYRRVTAPEVYRDQSMCYAFDARRPASCFNVASGSRTGQLTTYSGRYFPAYYLVVGLPTLLKGPGAGQLYLMRFVSVLLASALLASAVVTTREARVPSIAAVGVLVAVTPTALFLAGSVNPSGLEIAAAVGVWASGALLAARAAEDRLSNRIIDRVGIAAIVLVTTRPIGPLWLALAGLVVVLIAGTDGVKRLWRSARCRRWSVAIVAAAVVAVTWNLWSGLYGTRHYLGTPPPGVLNGSSILRGTIGKADDQVRQMIAVFGWLSIRAPSLTYIIWFLALGVLIGLAIALASRRWVLAVVGAMGATFAIPVALEAQQVRHIGFQWQGRYTLPLAVAVPVLAGFAVSESGRVPFATRRLSVLFIPALTVGQVLAFGQSLRSYSVGKDGAIWFFTEAVWNPPIPSMALIIVYATATLLFVSSSLLTQTARQPVQTPARSIDVNPLVDAVGT